MRPTILLVEDDADARAIFRDALTERGYRVLTATQGAEGVYMARRNRPDLILLDIRMPVMDGLDAIRYLRSYEGTARIPVWGISAYFSHANNSDPLLDRFDRLLPKPLRPDELIAEIDGHFGAPPPRVPNGT